MVEPMLSEATLAALESMRRTLSGAEKAYVPNRSPFSLPPHPDAVLLERHLASGIVEFSPADQVVVVGAGTSISDLQSALAVEGQCLPFAMLDESPEIARVLPLARPEGLTVGDGIDLALPHVLEAQAGTWRDWLLGIKLLLADGTLVNAGSRAVKNVAGYDVQKLVVGARGTVGIVVEATLRTYPLRAVPKPNIEVVGTFQPDQPIWVQRTLKTDYPAAVAGAGDRLLLADHATCTIWAGLESNEDLRRFPSDWVIRGNCGQGNLDIPRDTMLRLMKRAKGLMDPIGRLNPGAMGIF